MRRFFTVALLVALVHAVGAGCNREDARSTPKRLEKITIAVTPWPASAALYVAHEKGYLRDEGLDASLRSYTSGHLALDAVLAGRADVGGASESPLARAAVNGRPFAIVATISEIDAPIAIIARKDRGISVLDDLRGKKIGLAAGSAAEFFLHTCLTTSHVNPDAVRIVNVAPDNVVDALLSGEVDAVSTWAPHTIVLRDKLAGNAVVLQDPSVYTMTWNIVVTQKSAKNNVERIRRFLRAVLRANRFIKEHPDEARAVSAKHIGTNSALYEREWKDYRFIAALDQSLILNMENQARWMVKRKPGGGSATPNFMNFIYADALKAVQPESVRIPGK